MSFLGNSGNVTLNPTAPDFIPAVTSYQPQVSSQVQIQYAVRTNSNQGTANPFLNSTNVTNITNVPPQAFESSSEFRSQPCTSNVSISPQIAQLYNNQVNQTVQLHPQILPLNAIPTPIHGAVPPSAIVSNQLYINGFKIDSLTLNQSFQYQNMGTFCQFSTMHAIFDSQCKNTNVDNFFFNNFSFTSLNDLFYNKYSIFDFVSFFYCKNHSQNVLNNVNNYTSLHINNLLTKMKNYDLQCGNTKFTIPHQIYHKCLQLHYNQMNKKTDKKCFLFADIFNVLIHFDDVVNLCKQGILCGVGVYMQDYFETMKSMCYCLVEYTFYFGNKNNRFNRDDMVSYNLYTLFHANCQYLTRAMTPMQDIIDIGDYCRHEKEVLLDIINKIADCSTRYKWVTNMVSDMVELIRMCTKKEDLHIIMVLMNLFVENGKNNAINANIDNNANYYLEKLNVLNLIVSTILNTKHVCMVERLMTCDMLKSTHECFDRRFSDAILSKIYMFNDNDIDKCQHEFDLLCHWWVNIVHNQAKNGIELSLFQIEQGAGIDFHHKFPTPKILKHLFEKWMLVDQQIIENGKNTRHMATSRNVSHAWTDLSECMNKGLSISDENFCGQPFVIDRLLVHCLSSFFEDFMFEEDLNLLRKLNIFIKFGIPVGVIKIIVNYKNSMVCQECMKKNSLGMAMISGDDSFDIDDIGKFKRRSKSETRRERQKRLLRRNRRLQEIRERQSTLFDVSEDKNESDNVQTAWDDADNKIRDTKIFFSGLFHEFELYDKNFYFMPKILNWDLVRMNQMLKLTIDDSDEYTLNQWKLYFENRIQRCSNCCYFNSNDDEYQAVIKSKVSNRVAREISTLQTYSKSQSVVTENQLVSPPNTFTPYFS